MKAIQLFLFALFFLSVDSRAQNKWEYLPNVGIPIISAGFGRFEDVYFTDYQTGFAVTLKGYIYKTKDGGSTWTISLFDSSAVTKAFRSIEFLDDGKTGIVGPLGGDNYRTEDGGNTWTNITSAFFDTSAMYNRAICGLSHYGNNFYGVGWFNSKTAHFYRSKDKGLTWETTYIDSSLASALVDVVFVSEDTGFVCGFKGADYTIGSSVILKTTDGGKTWGKVFDRPNDHGIVWKLQFIDRKNAVASIEYSILDTISLVKSTDGGDNWNTISIGKPTGRTQGIGFVTPMKGWIGGYYSGLYETKDGGATWDTVSFGANFNRFFVMDSSHIYAAGRSIYRYGSDFTVGIRGDNQLAEVPHKIYPIVPNPSKGKIKIEFDLGTTTVVVLQVMNIESKRLWEVHRGVMNPGHYTFYWNEPNAPNGTYFIRLDNNEMAITEKFILAR